MFEFVLFIIFVSCGIADLMSGYEIIINDEIKSDNLFEENKFKNEEVNNIKWYKNENNYFRFLWYINIIDLLFKVGEVNGYEEYIWNLIVIIICYICTD